jgi:hypothetical protein
MNGKGVVAVSLPVRIFEKRSMLIRMCDLWVTGPKYLTKAGKVKDPIERFKLVMAFMISGMHMGSPQKKPFNPILGETYQCYWPDGTPIYIEHVSHHPPISSFLVENIDNLYTFRGSYEYRAKLADLGNSTIGTIAGTSTIEFADGQQISWEFPNLKIGGLMLGNRTIKYIGDFSFRDPANGIECKLTFNDKAGIFGNNQDTPLDQFRGVLTKDGETIHDVEGSWMSHLTFDE